MKSPFKMILTLGMLLLIAAACVSSPPPPPARLEPQAGIQAEPAVKTPEAPAAEIPAAPSASPDPVAEQTHPAGSLPEPQPTVPLAEPPVASAVDRPSSVPATASSVPTPASSAPPASSVPTPQPPGQRPTVPQPAPQPAPLAAPAPAPVTPVTPARPPTQVAVASPEKPRQVGEVVFTEGKVSVHRAGKSITPLDIGDVVYAYDVVITGPGSLAQVDLGAGRPGGAFIRLSENTAFYFDSKELSAEQRRTVLQILSGSIAIKVERLAGGSFSAVSDSAVLGVRGTEFIIDTIPDGSILVTCIEGAVAVQSPEGQTAIAQPGRAVIGRETGLAATSVGLPELAQFRSGWRRDSFTDFAGQAARYSSVYATTLDGNRGAFDAALARLRNQEATLQMWRDAKSTGREPRFTEWITEKKTVGAVLFDSLKALFLLERPYYRLLELKTLHNAGTGVGTLQDGRSTTEFFNQFDALYGPLADGMASVREALLLFSWASAGSPLGEFFGAKAESLGSGALLLGGDDW